MVQLLDTHWDVKFSREAISARLNNPKLETDLYPVGSWRDHPPTGVQVDLSQPQPAPPPSTDDDDDEDDRSTAGAAPEELRQALGLPACDGCAPGSNNWVIAGKHTASGKPLLANDMHLSLTEPNVWYMADLRAPGYHAAGVTRRECRTSSPAITSTWPGALPRSSPTCRTCTWSYWTIMATTKATMPHGIL